jgi:hypothetical protein
LYPFSRHAQTEENGNDPGLPIRFKDMALLWPLMKAVKNGCSDTLL